MRKNFKWLIVMLIMMVIVALADLNLAWNKRHANNVPVLKGSLIGISVILFLLIVLLILNKKKK